MNFKDKTVVITGGNSGIGYATADRFKQQGATVIITGRNEETLNKAAKVLGADPIVADQSNLADLDRLVSSVKEKYNSIDILFINAGINGDLAPIEFSSEENFDNIMNINFKGAYFTLSKFIPILKDGASVIFLSSIAATGSTRAYSIYSASKAALNSVARTAALELAPRKIRVNIVSPGPTKTEILNKGHLDPELTKKMVAGAIDRSPLGRMGEAVEIAKTVVHLCEETSGYITGAEFVIDGGLSAGR